MKKNFIGVFIILALCSMYCLAQDGAPKYTFNVGGGPSFPQGDISNFANTGANFVVGGGINLTHMFGANAEFMWDNLPPNSSVLALVGAPDGSARLYSVTGNLIAHTTDAHKAGFYGIGGIGWYHRSWELTRPVISVGTVCLPSYVWWGVVCSNGLVQSNATLASGSTNAFGWNIGAGVTYRLGGSHAKIYAEARYHRANTTGIDTQVLPLTFGLRW